MITVHHLENSRSQRVLWLLEELGLPYEVKRYARDRKTSLAPPELKKVHPLGKSPVITDGATTVAETGAIVEYLVDAAGGALRPAPGSADHRRWTYWLHFAEGSAMPPLVMALVFMKVKTAPMPFFARPIARAIADKVLEGFVMPSIESNTAFMEQELSERMH
jgi:glutathione S-transferase